MTVTVICPNLKCRSILQVPEATRGHSVRCGKCGTAFMVPAGKAAPVPSTAAPAAPEDQKKKK